MKLFNGNFAASLEFSTPPIDVQNKNGQVGHYLSIATILKLPNDFIAGLADNADYNAIAALEIGNRVVIWISQEESGIPQRKIFTTEADYIADQNIDVWILKLDNIVAVLEESKVKKSKTQLRCINN
jgi:hypothetical protein